MSPNVAYDITQEDSDVYEEVQGVCVPSDSLGYVSVEEPVGMNATGPSGTELEGSRSSMLGYSKLQQNELDAATPPKSHDPPPARGSLGEDHQDQVDVKYEVPSSFRDESDRYSHLYHIVCDTHV